MIPPARGRAPEADRTTFATLARRFSSNSVDTKTIQEPRPQRHQRDPQPHGHLYPSLEEHLTDALDELVRTASQL